jgi:transposase-like protein
MDLIWTSPGVVGKPGYDLSLGGGPMSTQRFIPESKEEAVRQVIERGYPVSEVASRVGVSTHSLYKYKWVKAVASDKTE